MRRDTPVLLLLPLLVACDPIGVEPLDPRGIDELEIADLQVLDNPDNVLSCWVRWSTTVPATSRVEFGPEGEGAVFFVEDLALVTDHELLVFGLRTEDSYELTARSVDASGAEVVAEPAFFEPGPLPFPAAHMDVTVHDESLVEPGWLLGNIGGTEYEPMVAVMYDLEGRIVWYHQLEGGPASGAIEVNLADDDTVVIGGAINTGSHAVRVDLAGQVLWQGPEQGDPEANQDVYHHVFRPLPDGNYLTLKTVPTMYNIADVVQEIDPEMNVLREWSSADAADVLGMDYGYVNTASLSDDGRFLYVGSAFAQQVYKWDLEGGEYAWVMGAEGDLAAPGDVEEPWFKVSHGAEPLPDGNLLLFDNGSSYLQPDEARGYSRIVEYEIDEQEQTAEVVWEYPGEDVDDVWYSACWGDADRLADGNTLVSAACTTVPSTPSRVFEVTADRELVYEAWPVEDPDHTWVGSFTIEKIPVLVGIL